MGFHTILPYIILLCLIKNVLCLKDDTLVVKSKMNPISYIISILITAFTTAILLYEGALFIGDTKNSIILCLVIIILFWSIVIYINRFQFRLFIFLGSVMFGLFSAIGNLQIYDKNGILGVVVSFCCWSFLFGVALDYLYDISVRYSFFSEPKSDYWKWGIVTFGVSCLIDSIFLLVYYPGVMTYDSFVQMCQVTGGISYSNHHPWLHTIMIKGIYQLGLFLFHSTNKAFALYGVFSIVILSFSLSCAVAYLRKKGLKGPFVVVVMLAYIMSPMNQMYSITMWKDIPFASVVLIFIVLLCQMCDNQSQHSHNRLQWLLFIPVSFAVCFLRSNGLYVFLGMIPFILWRYWREKVYAVGAVGIVLMLGLLYKGPVFSFFHVTEPDVIESLSIPAQQIGAVFSYEGDITEDQRNLLANIVDVSSLSEAYKSSRGCSDAIKNLVRETDNQDYISTHKREFIRLYLDLFKANKRIFVRAFVDETCGYWYHRVIFPLAQWSTYIEENGMGINRDSKLPDSVQVCFSNYLTSYRLLYDKYCSVGLYVYFFFASFVIALQRKSRYVISFVPILGIWGTLIIATPVFADLRYAYALYIALPFLVALSTIEAERT